MAVVSFVAFSVAALAIELSTDPLSLGYAQAIAMGDENGLATLLNAQRQGGGFQVNRSPIQAADLFNQSLIDAPDFLALTSTNLAQLLTIMALPAIDLGKQTVQDILAGIFPTGVQTRQNLTKHALRDGSRAEVLWGPGTVITTNEIDQALHS